MSERKFPCTEGEVKELQNLWFADRVFNRFEVSDEFLTDGGYQKFMIRAREFRDLENQHIKAKERLYSQIIGEDYIEFQKGRPPIASLQALISEKQFIIYFKEEGEEEDE